MRWETCEPDIRERMSRRPGGEYVADALLEALELAEGLKVLDLSGGDGVLSALMAKEYGVDVTCVAEDASSEAESEASAKKLGVADRVRVIPGKPWSLAVRSEEFARVLCLGNPVLPNASPEAAKELYRVLGSDGTLGFAGPVSLGNTTPDYMRVAMAGFEGKALKTPAYTALMFSREGFHIAKAEYLGGAWDHWLRWLDAPADSIPEKLREGIIEDGGRWLSMGLIVLKKPPKPRWAL